MEKVPPETMTQCADDGVNPAKLVKHYSSNHRILLLGEGDFSFSLSLAIAFRSASNIVATSLDPYNTLLVKYKSASSNLAQLRDLGATILHGVDATKLKDHLQPSNCKFDRIVFNFPHAGFFGKEENPILINMHKNLVHGFFSSARCFLQRNGEIHVSHKNSPTYRRWNLEQLARDNSLFLIEAVPFCSSDYPHYRNKRGDGLDCDSPFDLGDCSTFKFGMNSVKFMVKGSVHHPNSAGYFGALVNQKGSRIAIISGPLHENESDAAAELRAIREALLMFERSKLCGKAWLVVESDSKMAVSSIIKSDVGNPCELQQIIEEIRTAMGRIGNVDVECSDGEFGVGMQLQRLADELRVDTKSTVERWF